MRENKPDRKKANVTLPEPENMFRDLAEKSLVGIYLIQNGIFRYVNARMGAIFGYTTRELAGKMGPKDLVSPDDWPVVEENIARRIMGKVKSINYEFRGVKKNGDIIEIEAYGYRTAYDGEPALIGTLLDITKKKHSERLLKQAEELYRGIFENAIEGIFQTTLDGRVVAANQALASMLGFDSTEEFLSSVTDIGLQHYVDPGLRKGFVETLERDGIVMGFECELYKKDRNRIWAVMNARVIKSADGVVCYEGTVQDITEQKKAEEAVLHLNEFNRAIIDNAPVAIFTLNRAGAFTSVNPALAELSGLGKRAAEKLIGFNWLKNTFTIKCGLANHIRKGLKGEPFQLWDFPFMNYSGDRNVFIDFKGVPLKDKKGKINGLLCIIEETTDRVKTRAKLMQETKISAIGRLAAGAAHELNNPLATLVAFSEIASDLLASLKSKNGGDIDMEKLGYCLDTIQQQAFRCKNVIADLLSLSRKDGLEISDVEVNPLIEGILETTSFNKHDVRIIKRFSSSLPPAKVDISALRQVVLNVMQNAMDAVEGRMDATIWIRTRFRDNVINIEIEDNGVGIPDSIVDKIFEPFFTTKETKRGIGLGLSLCQEFLTSMGGTIRAESKPRYGTTFFLTLPAGNIGG